MSFWTLDRLTAALSMELDGARPQGSVPLGAIATDTRSIAPGDVFVALTGERYDAHDFLAQALELGASALVVSDAARSAQANVPVFVVRDTTAALGALGSFRRRCWGKPLVAVAGSNGKTSTKGLIAAALGASFTVHATRGNLNNHVGVPLSLLAIPDEADLAVIEIGTNHPGEVATLRALAQPDIAVLTSIGEEHLEGLGDLDGVLREEGAIFDGVALAITPASQPEVAAAARPLAGEVIEAGLEPGDVHPDTWGLTAHAMGWMTFGDVRMEVPLAGVHNLRNAVLAIAVARACGVSDADAAREIGALPQIAMRSAIEQIGSLMVLNDAYNANPASAREALATLDAVSTDRMRVVVLGSMLELGAQSASLHEEIARRALASRAGLVAGVGEFERVLRDIAAADPRVVTSADAESLWPALSARLPRDAFILLKGSRGTRLERLIPKLREFAGLPPEPEGPGVGAH